MKKSQPTVDKHEQPTTAGRKASSFIKMLFRSISAKSSSARIRKASLRDSGAGQKPRAPEWFAAQMPVVKRIQGRISPVSSRLLRALPAAAAILILSTLVVFLTVGPGAGVGVLQAVPTGYVPGPTLSAGAKPVLIPYEPDYLNFYGINRGENPALPLNPENQPNAVPTEPVRPTAGAEPPETAESSPTVVPTSTPIPAPTAVPLETDANGVVQEGVPIEDFTPDNTTFYVEAFKANVRTLPGTDAEIVTAVQMGDQMVRTGYGDFWSSITLDDGQKGYILTELISSDFIYPVATPVPTATPVPVKTDENGVIQESTPVSKFTKDSTRYYVKAYTANLRKAPNTDSDIVAKLTMGDKLTRIGYGTSWSKVRTSDDTTGYILTKLITTSYISSPSGNDEPDPTTKPTAEPTAKPTAAPDPDPEPTTAATPTPEAEPTPKPTAAPEPEDTSGGLTSAQKQDIVDLCKSLLGIKYVYGSSSLSGMDCSGLTSYVYRELFDITLPRISYQQAKTGISISRSNIEIGDILCFDWDRNGTVDHVGIYIGGGQYIHASYSRGKVVQSEVEFGSDPVKSIRRIIY